MADHNPLREHYGDPQAEYHHARETAGLFDVSDRGQLELTGKDAAKFLHNLSTNDIINQPPDTVREAYLCTAKARVVGQVWIHHGRSPANTPVYGLDMAPGQNATIYQHLDRYLISEDVQIADRTTEYVQFHIAGPKAREVLESAHLGKAIGGVLRPNVMLASPGYDLVWTLKDQADELWERLVFAGAKPAGLLAYHTLRVEAGTPMFGRDIDENRLVFEIGRTAQAISYSKGCYLGQEPIVMARDRGHTNRLLLGLKLTAVVPAGSKVLRDGAEMGVTASCVMSPRLGPIALAYLRRPHWEAGIAVEVESNEERVRTEVVALPFPEKVSGTF